MMRNQKEKPALSKKLSNLMIWRIFFKVIVSKNLWRDLFTRTPYTKHKTHLYHFQFFFATAIEWQVDKSFTFHVKSLGGNLEHYIFSIDFLTNYIVVGSELPNRDFRFWVTRVFPLFLLPKVYFMYLQTPSRVEPVLADKEVLLTALNIKAMAFSGSGEYLYVY